jgi:hypothetical protein
MNESKCFIKRTKVEYGSLDVELSTPVNIGGKC